jgi:hypothetical protein
MFRQSFFNIATLTDILFMIYLRGILLIIRVFALLNINGRQLECVE